jgi:hypothetical protein
MTESILSSPTKEVRIGFDRPFVIIGERINPPLSRRSPIGSGRSPIAKTPEAAAPRPAARTRP